MFNTNTAKTRRVSIEKHQLLVVTSSREKGEVRYFIKETVVLAAVVSYPSLFVFLLLVTTNTRAFRRHVNSCRWCLS